MSDFKTIEPILFNKPFKLGTTSFIYPDYIIPNVKKLGAHFDEIELLVFESQPESVLPSKNDVQELLYLSQQLELTYNIHLPCDVSLTCDSPEKRQKAADTLLKVIDLFAPINPSTHTLHLEMPPNIKEDINRNIKKEIEKDSQNNIKKLKIWQDNTRQGLEILLADMPNPDIISIETLDYPFSLAEPLVENFSLSVCIDAGHLIKYGYDLEKTFETQKHRTSIIHLHGVDFSCPAKKDHTSLDRLPPKQIKLIQRILHDYTGVVSLEVFNLENLNRSIALLSKIL
jgi:sugar phosphate isomerase/epimerase